MPSEDRRIRRPRDQTSALAKKRTLDGPCGSLENAARALDPYNRVIEENAAEDSSSDAFLLSIQPEHGGTHLWIRDDTAGDPQAVIDFVLRCAEECGLT